MSVILHITSFGTLFIFNFDSNYLDCTMHLFHEKNRNWDDKNSTCEIETIVGGPKI